MIKKLALNLLFLSLAFINAKSQDPDSKTNWWGDIDGYINQQDKVTLDLVNEALKIYPPSVEESLSRKMTLIMIDNVMHEEKAPFRPAVQEFFHSRISGAIDEIKSAKIEKGAMIWKMYDHAWIVKTASVTMAFDLQRGIPRIPGFVTSKEKIKELIDIVDILFISHFHDDHADNWVAEQFIAQNKPVISPPGIFESLTVYAKIYHPERIALKVQNIKLPKKGLKLSVVVNPGHQGENILNNVYIVTTPEGFIFSHTGDQSYEPDFQWIDEIGDNFKIDILFVNSWYYQTGFRTAKGFKPRLIIPGHENELGHTIDHREPFWLNNNRMGDKASHPWLNMTWGEKYYYLR